MSAAPKVFVSYAWEDEAHSTWVKALAERLRTQDGLDVSLDRWNTQLGDQLPLYMEKSVRESHFVLLICTPTYKTKFDNRLGGVGYEARNIAGEIQAGLAKRKVIPIHRSGSWNHAAPSLVLGDFYVDLTGAPYKEVAYRNLVETLHGRREIAPPVGLGDVFFEGPAAVPARPIAHFSGREDELRLLANHLQAPNEKVICVVASGIGGVGKTALARQLVATQAARLFPEGSVWLDAKNLTSELARVARRFGWSDETDPTPLQATNFLLKRLHERALLLVIDNLAGDVDATHVPIPGGKCRTLITSRAVNMDQNLGVPVETIRLEHWSPQIGREYLREVVPRLVDEPETDLEALSEFVQGLPLAIRLIARALLGTRDRSAKDHLARLKAEPLAALDRFAGGPDRGVAATFLDAYRALSVDEQKVLRTLAVCAQGTCERIVSGVAGLDGSTATVALNRLADVSLAEFRDGAKLPWTVHDVVRMFVHSQPEIRDAEAAHLEWVAEHIRRHIDPIAHEAMDDGIAEVIAAFERLLDASKIDQASEFLGPVYGHLTRRGLYALTIDLGERLLARLSPSDGVPAAQWLGRLGLCHHRLGNNPLAIDLIKRSLAAFEKLGSPIGQATQLGNLANCHLTIGDLQKAIDLYQRSLVIQEELGNLEGQATCLANLGGCYFMLRDIPKAVDLLEGALEINEELGNLVGQAGQLGTLGLCYFASKDIPKAIDVLKRSLAMNETLGHLEGQAVQLGTLGNCYLEVGDVPKAVKFYQRALAIDEQVGTLKGQANHLGNLGNCHSALGDIPKAVGFYQRSLAIDEQVGSLEGQANQLGNLGKCYLEMGDVPTAIDYYQRSLSLFDTMGLSETHPSVATIKRGLSAARKASK